MNSFIGIFAEPLGFFLEWLYGIIGSYGLSIIALTVIVKVVLYPLYVKQTKSMAGMTLLQPKVKALQQKYANDKEMLNQKLSQLYKEEKINPAGGCLPMLIQMPVIFGLFALLRNPMSYIEDPSMIFAVHESFLWMMDLSQPDKWILPIAAGVATFISFSMSQNQNAMNPTANQMGGMMKAMKYVFPVMIVLMGRAFPAGLTIYWFLGQFMQIFFNLHLKKIRERIQKEAEERKQGKR